MKVSELIEKLQQFPPDLNVWVSDGGYCEGAEPCIDPIVRFAWDAALDGDEVSDEYFYNEDNVIDDPIAHGYVKHDVDDIWTREIVLIRSTLD